MAKGDLLSSKALTNELRKLSAEAFTITDDGTPVTRAQRLAELIWRLAVGYTETITTDSGNKKEVEHPPVPWAMKFAFERIEGRSPEAQTEETERISAADKVRQLSKDRINKMAAVASGPPKLTKPPKGDA
jgi:hypothetical protein